MAKLIFRMVATASKTPNNCFCFQVIFVINRRILSKSTEFEKETKEVGRTSSNDQKTRSEDGVGAVFVPVLLDASNQCNVKDNVRREQVSHVPESKDRKKPPCNSKTFRHSA